MALEGRRGPLLCRAVDLAALVLRSLDEQGGDGRGHFPAALLSELVEERAIRRRTGEERDALEARQVHPQPPRILEEQLRVRPARDEPARLFLVQVLGQLAAHLVDGAL